MKKLFSFLALMSLIFTMVVIFAPVSSASPQGQDHPVLYASADVQNHDISPANVEMEAVKPLPVTVTDSQDSKVDTALTKILNELKTIPQKNSSGLFGVGWDWLKTVYLLIYLLIGMLYPTSKEWDFLLWPLKLLQKFIPNLSSTGGTHVSTLWQDIKNLLNGL